MGVEFLCPKFILEKEVFIHYGHTSYNVDEFIESCDQEDFPWKKPKGGL